MLRFDPWLLSALWLGCTSPSPPAASGPARVEGELKFSGASRGNAYLFLTPVVPDAAPGTSRPDFVTGVSDVRLAAGDQHYVFGAVTPNPYQLTGVLAVGGHFRLDLDVLAQAGAGDQVADPIDLSLQPGEHRWVDVTFDRRVELEPPAFALEDSAITEVELPDQGLSPALTLKVDSLKGLLDPQRLGFAVGLQDLNGDGIADDADGDGLPDLFPQLLLRFLPRPGQEVRRGPSGTAATVVVPMFFNPAPYLLQLGGDLNAQVRTDALTALVVPRAQAISMQPGKGRVVEALDAIPVGEYQLVVLQRSGQFWFLPNALASNPPAELGGPFPEQGVRFRFVHGSGFDGGF